MNNTLVKTDGSVPIVLKNIKQKFNKKRLFLLAVSLIIVSIFAFFYFSKGETFKVSLDLNPSFAMDIAKDEKVANVESLNDDAKKVLGNMNLKGLDIDVAMNAVMGSLLKNGYLKDQYTFLISVEGNNKQKADYIKYNVVQETSKILSGSNLNGTIYNQVYTDENSDISQMAAKYGISYSKANFISDMIKMDSTLNVDELSKMNMSELNKLIHDKSLNFNSGNTTASVHVSGTVETKKEDTTTAEAPANNDANAQQNSQPNAGTSNTTNSGSSSSNQSQNQNSSSNAGVNSGVTTTPPSTSVPTPSVPSTTPSTLVNEINSKIASFQNRYNQLAAVVNFQNVFSYIAQIKALDSEINYYEDQLEFLASSGKLDWSTYHTCKMKLEVVENQVDRLEDFYDD